MLAIFFLIFLNQSRRIKILSCPNDCSSVGLCDTKTGKCICPPTFSSDDCSSRICDCSGHGTCKDETCICDPDFIGAKCEISKLKCPNNCEDEFSDVPNGTCDWFTGKCKCRMEYGGEDCSVFIGTDDVKCKNDCSGNGECDLYHGKCKCNIGYIGLDCSVNLKNSILCKDDCNKQGQCDYKIGKCQCVDGFQGQACEIQYKDCPNKCSSPNGICFGEKGCQCTFPFVGPDCSKNACDTPKLKNCSFNGQCSFNDEFPNGFCICNKGTQPPDCQF